LVTDVWEGFIVEIVAALSLSCTVFG